MFENLTERLVSTFRNLSGRGHLTEDNIQEALRHIRLSLLEADVALPIVKEFIDVVREQAIGQKVVDSLQPDQMLVKIVHKELIRILGDTRAALDFKTQPPAIFLIAGLQGAGKTTTTAKLAAHLKEVEKKNVMMASLDVYRPAAIDQLKTLAEQVGVACYPTSTDLSPVNIAKQAVEAAKKQYMDVLLLDTAGRLHVDANMMDEIRQIHSATAPIETLFVVDSMTGQDAVNTANAFHEALPLTGIILTKTDGDARGGAALSLKYITGQPIKYMGTGEKIDAFEAFYPDRMASRILGMGDVLTLIEEAARKTDKKASEKLVKKLKKGKSFDLEDFKSQLLQMNKIGGMMGMVSKLPGFGQIPEKAKAQVNDKVTEKMLAILNSMTAKERRLPKIIMGSRKKRIALGSGTQIQDVNRLLKQFEQMQKMLKKITKPGGMQNLMRKMGGQSALKNLLPESLSDKFDEK
ncbi:MAG: signal recognition particle protein [Legionella sp.]|nr:signal recognition particle protein [Legionella sp.]